MVRRIRARLPGYVLVAPAVVVTVLFFLVPMVVSGYWSLTDYNGIKPPVFVGLDDYAALLGDPRFLRTVRNTAFFVVFGLPGHAWLNDPTTALPAVVGLALLARRDTVVWCQTMAGTVVAVAPMVVIFLVLQRRFIEGLTAGSVKGEG